VKWAKRGRVYRPDGTLAWARHSALTPTPVLIDGRIRVFAGFRDDAGISRIGWVDVDPERPDRVLEVSATPALNVGTPGCFDDNGVILGDVVRLGDEWRMYYVGFQHVARAKFLAFTGLAVADRDARSFRRASHAPVLDRTDEGLFIRALHSIRREQGEWRAWYAAGSGWEMLSGQPYPRYEIRHVRSRDGVHFAADGDACIRPAGAEYRVGRPRVFGEPGRYRMLYTRGDVHGGYVPGYAESTDGLVWERRDGDTGIAPGPDEWDARALCYLAPIDVGGRRLAFYNGNDMGREGFGYAELVRD
jgi:hypothetical protein